MTAIATMSYPDDPTLAAQATTIAATGLIIGIRIRVVVGTVLWRTVANGLGVTHDGSHLRLRPILTAIGGLALVNLIAAFPARTAANTQPAVALRTA